MGSAVETSSSSTRTRPEVGRTRALTVRRRVVLPEPLRPRRAVVVFGSMREVDVVEELAVPCYGDVEIDELDALGGHGGLRRRVLS